MFRRGPRLPERGPFRVWTPSPGVYLGVNQVFTCSPWTTEVIHCREESSGYRVVQEVADLLEVMKGASDPTSV
jgi:hypothetical protein